jgi:hypothetical protein
MAENVPMYAPPPYAPKLEWKHSRKLGDDLAPDIEAATVEAGRSVLCVTRFCRLCKAQLCRSSTNHVDPTLRHHAQTCTRALCHSGGCGVPADEPPPTLQLHDDNGPQTTMQLSTLVLALLLYCRKSLGSVSHHISSY